MDTTLMKFNDPKFISALVATFIAIVLAIAIQYDPHVDQQTKINRVENIGQTLLYVWIAVIGGTALHQYGETKANPASSSSLQNKLETLLQLTANHPEIFKNIQDRLTALENNPLPSQPIPTTPEQKLDNQIQALQQSQPITIMPNLTQRFPPGFSNTPITSKRSTP